MRQLRMVGNIRGTILIRLIRDSCHMQCQVGNLVFGQRGIEAQLNKGCDKSRAFRGFCIGAHNRGNDCIRLPAELLMLMNTYEQIPKMGDETADINRMLIQLDVIGAFDDSEQLLDDAGIIYVGERSPVEKPAFTKCSAKATLSLGSSASSNLRFSAASNAQPCWYSRLYSERISEFSGYGTGGMPFLARRKAPHT